MDHDTILRLSRVQTLAMLAGAVGLVGWLIGVLIAPGPFFRSYLVAYVFWLGIGLGGLVVLMTYHLTGGRWGLLVRRIVEASSRTLPLLALLFIPILVGIRSLYLWARPEEVSHSELLQHKEPYLNLLWFAVRAGIYFLTWIALAWSLTRWSRRHDETDDPRLLAHMRTLSGPGLVLYGLTITFASTDWVMSLQPHWYSTAYSMIFAGLQFQLGLAFAVVMLVLLATGQPMVDLVRPQYFRDLGGLLLAVVMFWAYVEFSQFMLIWIGNLPEEIGWYLPRFEAGWEYLSWSLIVCQLGVPFMLLLFRRVKQNRRALGAVAVWVLLMALINLFWQIIPAFPPASLAGHWLDILATLITLAGIGGIWIALFVGQLRKSPLIPPHDPILAEVKAHE